MCNSPAMRILGMVVWLITAVAAIFVGLEPWGRNYLKMGFLAQYQTQVAYVILAAGIISLLMYIVSLTSSGCCSDKHPHAK